MNYPIDIQLLDALLESALQPGASKSMKPLGDAIIECPTIMALIHHYSRMAVLSDDYSDTLASIGAALQIGFEIGYQYAELKPESK